MTQKPALPDASKPFSIAEYEKQRLAIIERGCAELGVDEAELFRRVRERLRFCCQQLRKRSGV
jgi:hypothetical protein